MNAYGDTYFSWHGYDRDWKSDAFWVDLRPVRARIEQIQRRRPGKTAQARAYNTVGECAAALLFAGTVNIKDTKLPDVMLRSGDLYEVRTSFWGGSEKFPPKMTSAKRGPGAQRQRKVPTVWCVTRRFPDCYNGAWVVGVISPTDFVENRQLGGGKFAWAYLNPWKDGLFTSPAEVMQDELHRPALPVGMTGRISREDIGIVEYLESYGFLKPLAEEEGQQQASHD